MQQIVHFFWTRWKRACQMDAANKHSGKHTPYWIEAEEWITAYKQTLSKGKQREFDKEWDKLERYLEQWRNAKPDTQKSMKNPMDLR